MKLRSLFLACVICFAIAMPAFALEAFRGPTGLLKNDSTATYQGYTLITPIQAMTTYLIDMEGNIVNTWKSDMAQFYSELLPNGNLLQHLRFGPDKQKVSFGGEAGKLREVDWNGKVVWEYTMFGDDIVSHHAFDRMPNGNTMLLGWEKKSYEELIAKGRKEGVGTVSEKPLEIIGNTHGEVIKIDGIWPDFIREVNPKGETVWEFHVWDNIGTGPDQFDINFIGVPNDKLYGGPDWTHWNSVRYNAETNQVLVDSRNWGELYIIDYATKKIVHRWGNPAAYGQGERPSYNNDGDQKLFGVHDVTWLANGNIGMFDNGTDRPTGSYSRVVEYNPKTSKVEWFFTADTAPTVSNSFYSSYQSSAQKLANNNWLVTSTWHGHVFEVTPNKKVVWEYVNPMAPNGVFCSTTNSMPMMVHRAFRYAADFPGLQGKDLSPKGKLTDGCPDWEQQFKIKPWMPGAPASAKK